jgi:hypothetical protein
VLLESRMEPAAVEALRLKSTKARRLLLTEENLPESHRSYLAADSTGKRSKQTTRLAKDWLKQLRAGDDLSPVPVAGEVLTRTTSSTRPSTASSALAASRGADEAVAQSADATTADRNKKKTSAKAASKSASKATPKTAGVKRSLQEGRNVSYYHTSLMQYYYLLLHIICCNY